MGGVHMVVKTTLTQQWPQFIFSLFSKDYTHSPLSHAMVYIVSCRFFCSMQVRIYIYISLSKKSVQAISIQLIILQLNFVYARF